jgi:hypothetical protein
LFIAYQGCRGRLRSLALQGAAAIVMTSGLEDYPIPHIPLLGQQPPLGQPPAGAFAEPVTAENVDSRMVARGWPHEGQLTLSESAARATRFSNSAPH